MATTKYNAWAPHSKPSTTEADSIPDQTDDVQENHWITATN